IAAASAATSTGAWLAHATRTPRGVAHADARLATALDEDLTACRDALAAGVVDGDQVRVIARAVAGLPEAAVALDASLPGRAERHLLELAGEFDARALRRLARHVLEVLDPGAADLALGKRLDAEERAAARRRFLELFDNGDGTHTGRFRIDTLHAAMLRKALEALTHHHQHQHGHRHGHPLGDAAAAHVAAQQAAAAHAAHQKATRRKSGRRKSGRLAARCSAGGAGGCTGQRTTGARGSGTSGRTSGRPGGEGAADAGGRRPRPEVLGQALCRLLERLDPTRLPRSGGVNATVVVLLDYDQLLTGLGTARLDTGERISAGAARRLACEAGVIPAVYRRLVDGRSVVLDMGRKRRYYTEIQRIALDIEQGGCTTEGCDRPAAWCDAHHDVPWSEGGPTDLPNGRLLCPFHHGKAHSPAYRMERLPNGKVAFHRRT
ncbi:MAG TPA: DUF222 domain-containing protein, partial [Streptomyces sp.]